MPLTLVVPDLLPPADAPAPMREVRLPGLERAFGRADIARERCEGPGGWLAADWGLVPPVPYAAIALAGDEKPHEGTWLRADPVHLRIERDLVALHDASVLDVTREEADVLVAALQALFRDDGLEFRVPAPDRWYVRVPDAAIPQTTPLHAVVGRDIFSLLPRGTGPLNWRSMITESQMVLSGHEANTRREAAGQPAINSVWFWGEGARPASVRPRYAAVWANDSFTRGLARLSGVEARPLPERFEAIVGTSAGETLVVVDELTRWMRRGDIEPWLAAAKAIDERWLGPASKSAARFGTARIVLPAEPTAVIATLAAKSRWRWPKRSRLCDHA